MMGESPSQPALFQMVDLEALVPEGHRLRRLEAVLDLSFVREVVADCYADGRGRPSIDPELAVRMLLLAELYDLSDRELCDELAMHAGMRWFCRLDFHDPVPDHSTLSRLRGERWAESGLWERIHDEVIRQCTAAGLVSGRHLSVDGTLMEANASMKSLERRGPRPVADHDEEEDRPPPRGPGGSGGSSRSPAPDPQPRTAWKAHGERFSNETYRSTTDPDARLYRKGDGREARLSYLVHDLIDTKSRVILKRRASRAASSAEPRVAVEMLDEVLEKQDEWGLAHSPEVITGDTAYGSTAFVTEVLGRGLVPHVPLLSGAEPEELPTWQRRTTRLDWQRNRQKKVREAKARNRVREEYGTRGYTVSRKLRIRSEHLFGEGKEHHGLGVARRRGLERVDVQSQVTAIVQNLKRLAAHVHRRRRGTGVAALRAHNPVFAGVSHARRLLRRLQNALAPIVHTIIGGSLDLLGGVALPQASEMAPKFARFSTAF